MPPPLPAYLLGDDSAPTVPPRAVGPPLPPYLSQDEPPAPKKFDPSQLGAYLRDQGAQPGLGKVETPKAWLLDVAQAVATKMAGVPLAGALETYRDAIAAYPWLAAAAPLPSFLAAHTPEGTTAELQRKAEQQRQDYLVAHPGTGGALAAFGTELGVNALPLVTGAGALLRGGVAAPTMSAALRGAARAAPVGGAVGGALGYAGSYGSPTSERLTAAAGGAGVGTLLGGVGGLAARPALPRYLAEVEAPGASAEAASPLSRSAPETASTTSGGEIGAPGAAGEVAGFTTSQGSSYKVNGTSTTRTKTPHPGHPIADVGAKPPSEVTYYVPPEEAQRLGMHGSLNAEASPRLVIAPDGTVQAISRPSGAWGADGAPIQLSAQPEVGLAPLELWRGQEMPDGRRIYGSWHAGNPIVDIQAPPPIAGRISIDSLPWYRQQLGDETARAMTQAVAQAADRAAPGRAVRGVDGSVVLPAESEAQVHATMALVRDHLATNPLEITLPDGSQARVPIGVTYGVEPAPLSPYGQPSGAGADAAASLPGGTAAGRFGASPRLAGAAAGEAALGTEAAGGQAGPGAAAVPPGAAGPAAAGPPGTEAALPGGGAAEGALADAGRGQAPAAQAAGALQGLTPEELAIQKATGYSHAEMLNMRRLQNMSDEEFAAEHESNQAAALAVAEHLATLTTDQLHELLPTSRAFEKAHPSGTSWATGGPPPVDMIWQQLHARLGISGDSPQELGYNLQRALGQLTSDDPTSAAAAQGAIRQAARLAMDRGWDTRAVTDQALRAYAERFDPADREFMLGRLRQAADPFRVPNATAPSALPAPLRQLPAAPDSAMAQAPTRGAATALRVAEESRETTADVLKTGEAGWVKNPFAPPTPEQMFFREVYPLKRSFVNQLDEDRQAAIFHGNDLVKAFPDRAVREDMVFAFEKDPEGRGGNEGNPRYDHAGEDGSHVLDTREEAQARLRQALGDDGYQRVVDEHERQTISSALNLQMLRDLGRVPEDLPDVENYLRHEWEPLPSSPRRFSFGSKRDWLGYSTSADPTTSVLREREFPTLAAGIRAGRTPATPVDWAAMVRAGDEDFSRTLALHRLMQDVSELPAMADGRPAFLRVRGPGSRTEVLEALRKQVAGKQAATTDPEFAAATAGAEPLGPAVKLSSGKFLIEGEDQPLTLDQARARVGMLGESDPARTSLGEGYVQTHLPLLNRAIPGKGDLYVRQELDDALTPILMEPHPGLLGRALDAVTAPLKWLTLFGGTFHNVELTMQNVVQRGLIAGLLDGFKRGFGFPGINQATRALGWGNIQREAWLGAVRRGVNVDTPEPDANAAQLLAMQKILVGLAQRAGVDRVPGGAAVTDLLSTALGVPHDALFRGYMAPLKVALDTANYEKLMRLRAGEDFAMGIGGWLNRNAIRAQPEAEAIQGNTDASNNAFGGQQWRLFQSRFASDPRVQAGFSRAFLTPDWWLSGARLMAEPFSRNPTTRALGINMYLRSAFYLYGGANLVNYALTRYFSPDGRGHFMFDNEPGHTNELQIGPNHYMNVGKLQKELPEVVGKQRLDNWMGVAVQHLPGVDQLRQATGAAPPVMPERFEWDPSGTRDSGELPVLGEAARKVHPLWNALFGAVSGHSLSGYPTELTKAQQQADTRMTGELPDSRLAYLGRSMLQPETPIPLQRFLAIRKGQEASQSQGGGDQPWMAALPFQVSHGLSAHRALPMLADLYRQQDQAQEGPEQDRIQQRLDEITNVLLSHQLGEDKVQRYLAIARSHASRFPNPTTATGKAPEAEAPQ
jgi:hypothetical protein